MEDLGLKIMTLQYDLQNQIDKKNVLIESINKYVLPLNTIIRSFI
jgi:hypothetical protein